jgi:hypothetical protein
MVSWTVPRSHRDRGALKAAAATLAVCTTVYGCVTAPEAESCSIAPPPAVSNAVTHVVYLFYADGQTPIPNGAVCNDKESVPPAFACSYGGERGILGCQLETQKVLNFWFSEFNVVFTLKPPESGAFQTVVVTHEGSWCGKTAGIAGTGRFDCTDQLQGVAYAFHCGQSALLCANAIAHEYGHLVGLEHVYSQTDIMSPGLCGDACAGFEDWDYPILEGLCGSSWQNSRQVLLARLGSWSQESAKPAPFDCKSQ